MRPLAHPCRQLPVSRIPNRSLATLPPPSPSAPPSSNHRQVLATSAAIGVCGGAFGAALGVGGGVVMVPLMTAARLLPTQQAAHATSLLAVAGTGLAAVLQYGSAGAVDVSAAAVLTTAAALAAAAGARTAHAMDGARLRRSLAVFLLLAAPAVPLAAHLRTSDRDDDSRTAIQSPPGAPPTSPGPAAVSPPSDLSEGTCSASAAASAVLPGLSWRAAAVCGFAGLAAGFTSGLLGVGGGIIMTPTLALTFGKDMPHHTIIGTVMLSTLLPASVGLASHARRGAVHLRIGLPLLGGALIGGTLAARAALDLPEDKLRLLFAVGMALCGLRMLKR